VEANWDVFVSYCSKDKPVVRGLAERLKADGLRVWFDEWEIRAGDSIQHKIDEGLERSRVLVLCMSAQAFGSAGRPHRQCLVGGAERGRQARGLGLR
jgi:hypothetical protein